MRDTVYTKTLRLTHLIRFFEAGGETTAAELAKRLGCHKRTANRLLLDVQAFVPLVEERVAHYRKMEGYDD